MATALNRAQIRDRVRRIYLGITPPIDPQPTTGLPVPGAHPGDAPQQRPDPSNAVLNDCLELSIQDLNRKCDYNENRVDSFPVSAVEATYRGPLFLSLQHFGGDGVTRNIRRVVWTDSAGIPPRILEATSWQRQDRLHAVSESSPPGLPQFYLLEQWELGIFPPPAQAGTLSMLMGNSPFGPGSDVDTIHQLPVDFHEVVYLGTAIRSLQRISEDAEARAKLQMITPQWGVGIGEIIAWKNQALLSNQPTFGFASYRVGSGLRRNRR